MDSPRNNWDIYREIIYKWWILIDVPLPCLISGQYTSGWKNNLSHGGCRGSYPKIASGDAVWIIHGISPMEMGLTFCLLSRWVMLWPHVTSLKWWKYMEIGFGKSPNGPRIQQVSELILIQPECYEIHRFYISPVVGDIWVLSFLGILRECPFRSLSSSMKKGKVSSSTRWLLITNRWQSPKE
jgi:hypothetical protein